jgi:hypothetical protein
MVLCFEWFSKQASIILLNSINNVACIIEVKTDLSEAGTDFLNIIYVNLAFEVLSCETESVWCGYCMSLTTPLNIFTFIKFWDAGAV